MALDETKMLNILLFKIIFKYNKFKSPKGDLLALFKQ